MNRDRFLTSSSLAGVLMTLYLTIAVQTGVIAQDCTNDTIPPVAACNEWVIVSLAPDDPNDCYGPVGPNGQPAALQGSSVAVVSAASFNDGSYDECSNIRLTVRRMEPYSTVINNLNHVNGQLPCNDQAPDFPSEFERAISEGETIKFYAGEFNTTQLIILRVYQLNQDGSIAYHNGSPISNECLVQVSVEDKIKPVCVPPANVTVNCDIFNPDNLATLGIPVVTDNACLDTVTTSLSYSNYNAQCGTGTVLRIFKAFDCSGNSSQCSQQVTVQHNQNYFVRFPDDRIVPTSQSQNLQTGEPVFFGDDCELLGTSYSDQVFLVDPNAQIRVERTWSIINWCSYNPSGSVTVVPNPGPDATTLAPANFPGPVVSAPGSADPWAPTVVSVQPGANPTDYSSFWSPNVNMYQYVQKIWITDTSFAGIEGRVFSDTTSDCTLQAGETLLEGWTVRVTGLVSGIEKVVTTDAEGRYSAVFGEADTALTVTLVNAGNLGQGCATFYTVNTTGSQYVQQDIPVHLNTQCNMLTAGIAAPIMRRCFNNTYRAQICNLSGQPVPDSYTEIELDPYQIYLGSSIPGILVSGNTYRFDLGDLLPGDCREFSILFKLSCDAPLGATHCSEARAYPRDECGELQLWSGADVEVTANCDGDSVKLRVSNAGTGPMSQELNYIVVEDIIMRQSNGFQLAPGEEMMLSYPANGSTWRIEAEEEPFHPFGGLQAAVTEGCGGLNQPGLVNLFSLSNNDPFVSLDCTQNTGSFDPNDKQAVPTGYGQEHQIKPNTDIEYLIRFQNTGTDTAFSVVIMDTLSNRLDPSSVRVLASSHPMEYATLDNGIIRFAFPDIMLPDSNVNLIESNGFVKFRISQQADNPDGTVITNRAAIYFDFNEPVITNTTFHTVRKNLMLVSAVHEAGLYQVQIIPNPSTAYADLIFESELKDARFELFDKSGRLIRTEQFSGNRYRLERNGLRPGIYTFRVGGFAGKVAITD